MSFIAKIIGYRFDKDDPSSIINEIDKCSIFETITEGCEDCHTRFFCLIYKLSVGKGKHNFKAYLCKNCIYLLLGHTMKVEMIYKSFNTNEILEKFQD